MKFNFTLLVIFLGCLAGTAFAQTPTLSPNGIDFSTVGYPDGPLGDQADWWESKPNSFIMESGVLIPSDSSFARAIFQVPFSKEDTAFTIALRFDFSTTTGSPAGNRIAIATELLADSDSAAGERYIHRLQRRGNGSAYRLQLNNQSGGSGTATRATGDIPNESFGFGANDTVSDELWFEATFTKISVDSGWTAYSRVYNLTGDSLIKDLAPSDTFLSSAAFYADSTLYAGISLGQPRSESQISNIRIYAFDYYSVGVTMIPPADTTAPVLTLNSGTSILQGTPISVTSNEDGTIFLVPSGTIQNLDTIMDAQVGMASAVANMAVDLPTMNVDPGSYIVYATDSADNVSEATDLIELTPSSISNEFAASTSIYPNPVTKTLKITSESPLSHLELYNLQGQKLLTQAVSGKQAEMDLEELAQGLYLIKVFDSNNRSFIARISRQ